MFLLSCADGLGVASMVSTSLTSWLWALVSTLPRGVFWSAKLGPCLGSSTLAWRLGLGLRVLVRGAAGSSHSKGRLPVV